MKSRLFAVLLLLILLCLPAGCRSQQPILVGFAAEMSGRRGELGVAARDSAQLAIDQINAAGGIDGRPLKLLTRDDKGSPETARQVDQELVDAGVVAIIGHMTSEQSAAVFDQMNRAQVVIISPTSSSTQFSGQKDSFFRVMPDTQVLGAALAKYIQAEHPVRQVAVIYDLSNQAFTQHYWLAFKAEMDRYGVDTSQVYSYTTGQADLQALVDQVAAAQPESILFVSSAFDTALMAQYAHSRIPEAALFSSTWGQTDELFAKGGKAVEGMLLGATYNPENKSRAYLAFSNIYQERYKRAPSLAASHAYEAVLLLAYALRQTGGQASGLHQALVSANNLPGLQGALSLDEFGDVHRDTFVVRVQNARFVIVGTISPSTP